jgi:hypothetical protein
MHNYPLLVAGCTGDAAITHIALTETFRALSGT